MMNTNFVLFTVYSIVYGMYENILVYHTIHLLGYLQIYGNWLIMFSGFLTLCLYRKSSFVEGINILLWFLTLEDIVYFVCESLLFDRTYPYPVLDWYDQQLSVYGLLNLGTATSFFPYVPRFYYLHLAICVPYFLIERWPMFRRVWCSLTLPSIVVIITTSILIKHPHLEFVVGLSVVAYLGTAGWWLVDGRKRKKKKLVRRVGIEML